MPQPIFSTCTSRLSNLEFEAGTCVADCIPTSLAAFTDIRGLGLWLGLWLRLRLGLGSFYL